MNGLSGWVGRLSGRRVERGRVALIAALTLALLTVASAAAHADLISSEPAAGSTVAGSPATIRLSFSQPLQSTSTMQLFLGQFQSVAGLNTVVAGSEMQATLGRPLAPATYTVQWSAASDDGHTTEGSYQFAVAAAGPAAVNRLAPVVAAIATILSGGVAIFVWILNRRQRV
jgi:methionine-rich copper-binding protein CopC